MEDKGREWGMRFISSLDQHPEVRKERFPEHFWPNGKSVKDNDEGWIFLEFAESVGLTLTSAPAKLEPPMPDLKCIVDGRETLFELGEILESSLAEGVAYSGKQARAKMQALAKGDHATANSIQTAGGRSFSANGSVERILRQKLAKKYETSGLPCHLLLFYDQQTPWGPFEYLLGRQEELSVLIADSVF
jgi:hypothetical protein